MDDDVSVPGPSPDEEQRYLPAADEPRGVADLDSDRARRVAKAWQLHVRDGHSITYTAQALGVSRATAWRMAQEGRAQAALLPWLQREEVRTTQLAQLRAMRAWLYSDASVDGGKALDYVPVLLQVLDREIRIAGTAAPAQHSITSQHYIGPKPEEIAEIQATYEDHAGPALPPWSADQDRDE